MRNKKTSVLIVDDSALVRQVLTDIVESDRQLRVMAAAADPFFAAEKLKKEIPDVIILDIEMPRMDGLTFLKKIMTQYPIPVVVCSSLTDTGSETALRAIEYGAVDIITKPKIGIKNFLDESKILVTDAVKAAAGVRLNKLDERKQRLKSKRTMSAKLTADAVLPRPGSKAMIRTTDRVVVVGASTGGVEALRVFLESAPRDFPGTVIVQHMPENFTATFSKRLNDLCDVEVKEAADGDRVFSGRVLIAPGNRHTMLKRSGARYFVQVSDGPLVSRHRPSVDVLFRSAAKFAGKNAIGVIMTGMGDDGSQGMLEMKNAGAITLAQDEASSVIFGMPKEAIKLGAVKDILPLEDIADAVLHNCTKLN